MTTRQTILILALLAGCADDASVSLDAVSTSPAAEGIDFAGKGVALTPMYNLEQRRERSAVGNATGSAAQPAAVPAPAAPQTVASNMLIRNGSVTIRVDSLETAIARVRSLATAHGGIVAGMSVNAGEHQVRSATLELRIPAARFDSAMIGMPILGKVEQSTASAMDVGEEFVDVTARVANAKRLEERLIALLANRTGRLSDVIAVERELARVRQEIESYEGRIRFLSTRVATSTIHATVHEKAPIIAGRPGDNVLARAFVNMWRNFVRFLTLSIELAGVIVPIAAIGYALYRVIRRWRVRRLAPPTTA